MLPRQASGSLLSLLSLQSLISPRYPNLAR